MKIYFKSLLTILVLISSLGGCTALLLGGAAAAGGLSYADRRSTGAQTDDQLMELRIDNQVNSYLKKNQVANMPKSTVSTVSYNRNILLLGTVANENERQFAERVARSQTSARQVYNHISLATDRNIGNIANDSWITSKVRAMLLNPRGFSPNQVKIVTYSGITYAMGVLTPAEQAAASQQISTTAGVKKVVTLYETFNRQQ